MKKSIVFLILFSSLLFAEGTPLVLKIYATNELIDTSHISEYASKFKEVEGDDSEFVFDIIIESEETSLSSKDTSYKFTWVMIELDENLSTANYWIEHTAFDFTEHTFKKHQSIEKFSMLRRKFLSFYYDEHQDNRRYFFKISSNSDMLPLASLHTPQSFSTWIDAYETNLLLSFFLLGLIFMTAIYNGALYIYNREKSFLCWGF